MAASRTPLSPADWAIIATASLGAFLEVLDTSIVNVAVTAIQSQLGATLAEVGWVVTGYGIANVVILPLTAFLANGYGRRGYFVFSLAGFTAASVLCGLAPTLPWLVAGRIIQGLLGAACSPRPRPSCSRPCRRIARASPRPSSGWGSSPARPWAPPWGLPHRPAELAVDLPDQPALRHPGGAAGPAGAAAG